MSQAAGNDGQAVLEGEPEHVSVHTEASSFTPQQASEQAVPGVGPIPEAIPIVQPQFAANFMNFLQQMAGAYVPPPLPPPPPGAVVTIKKLQKNGAEEFLEYIPEHFVEAKREEFLKFTQGELTLSEYRQKFDELAGFGKDLVPTMEKRCKRFVEGLRPDLSAHLITAPRVDINALFKHALDMNAALTMTDMRSSFTPQQASEQAVPGVGPIPEAIPIVEPQFAAIVMNFLQQMAGAYVPPPPPPPPPVAVVTIEKLWKNGAEKFLGDQIADPMIAKRWFERTIRVLGNLRVPQEQCGDLAVALLPDSAYDWWKRVGADVLEPVQWATFDRLFHEEYSPEHFVEAKREEFLKFTQGELTLPEYRQKFDELAGFGQDLAPTVEKRCKRFLEGLRPDLSTHLIIAPRSDINALNKNALDLNAALIKKAEYEQTLGASTAPSRPPSPQKAGTSSKRSFAAPSSSHQSKKVKSALAQSSASVQKKGKSGDGFRNPICDHCGHRHPGDCWYTLGLCLGCGQAGHFRKDCPKNPGEAFSTAPAASAPAAQPARSQKSAAASSQPKQLASGAQEGKAPARTYTMRGRTEQPAHDVIMGMDWLTANQAVVDCGAHTVRLRAEDGSDVLIHGELLPKAPEFISYIHARRLIRKKCEAFLCTVRDTRQEAPSRGDIPTPTLQQQIASAQSSDDFCIHTVELVSRGEKPDFAVREGILYYRERMVVPAGEKMNNLADDMKERDKTRDSQLQQVFKQLGVREHGNLPATTEPNPREQLRAITLRSGKELQDPEVEVNIDEVPVDNPIGTTPQKKNESTPQGAGKEDTSSSQTLPTKQAQLNTIPFPTRVKKNKDEKAFQKFLDVIGQVEVKMPLVGVLTEMPKYADTVTLDENLMYEEEPVEILARKVRQLRNQTIPLVKVLWRSHTVEEATWETEESMRIRYPHLFSDQ
ncbi:unnamed protein product [Cuscuta campestris]|uniref:CCHC-type domain-containing protein n=1 Tax=Cuscuta campestris TaxID=132261 RepID=A0A484MB45_9ASTE|nr:unnamed protein product [Cuscuta campestris]